MLTILHASDLHFGKAFDPKAAEAFGQSVRELHPDLLVLSGDFTQRAKVREYEEAREFLQSLPDLPQVVTPGNHDVPLYRVWERIAAPLRNYRAYIASELDSVARIPGATVVSLNSTAPLRAIVNGRITDKQLLFAARAFQDSPAEDLRILVTHHHLAPAPDYESDQVLPGYQRCLDAFVKMEVDLLLGGHLHRAYVADSLDVYPSGGRDHGVLIVHSGTTTSRRGRARERSRNSFNLIRAAPDRIQVIRFVLFRDLGAFRPAAAYLFPRGSGGPLPGSAIPGDALPAKGRGP